MKLKSRTNHCCCRKASGGGAICRVFIAALLAAGLEVRRQCAGKNFVADQGTITMSRQQNDCHFRVGNCRKIVRITNNRRRTFRYNGRMNETGVQSRTDAGLHFLQALQPHGRGIWHEQIGMNDFLPVEWHQAVSRLNLRLIIHKATTTRPLLTNNDAARADKMTRWI